MTGSKNNKTLEHGTEIESINEILALQEGENKTHKLHAVLKADGLLLEKIEHQTEELCLVAIQSNGLALKYVKNQTPNLCLAAVKQNGLALQYIEELSMEECFTAVLQNDLALDYIKDDYVQELCSEALYFRDYDPEDLEGFMSVFVKNKVIYID